MRIRPALVVAALLASLTIVFHRPSVARAAIPITPPAAVFESPAGDRPDGPFGRDPFARVLPSGRILRPAGKSVMTGMDALGVALSPNGRFAIVSNDDDRDADSAAVLDPLVAGGPALAVIDVATMQVVSRYRDPDASFFAGIVAVRDPASPGGTLVLASGGGSDVVDVFSLSGRGVLVPDSLHPAIALPAQIDPLMANFGRVFPGPIAVAPDGLHAYVAGNLSNSVTSIDLRTRELDGPAIAVGFFPYGIATGDGGVFVANEGLATYTNLPAPAASPAFANVAPDLERASSLSIIPADAAGRLASHPLANLPMDPHPDGLHAVGGAHPSAVVAMRTKPYAFVAMTNVDRIATVAYLDGAHVAGGTELRLFDRGPYGTQPTALAVSPDEKRLYVALSGIDAVAVLDASDPRKLHRLGLIPTGLDPVALALSKNGRYLYVVNAKGLPDDVPMDGAKGERWSTLERIDLTATSLRETTPVALENQRIAHLARPSPVVPASFETAGSPITHVVEILEERKTYDAMLGDLTDASGLPYGPGDAALVAYDTNVTPNLHALARTFALAGNFYADGDDAATGHAFAIGGMASAYTERMAHLAPGRAPIGATGRDPEDYPRAGYLFDSLALAGRSFRDYGEFLSVSGYDDGASSERADASDTRSATTGLGGTYHLDTPALAALAGHVDLLYPGFDARIRDVRRAREFERDYDVLGRANGVPQFTQIWLPGDRAIDRPDLPPLAEQVADGDRALGRIVDYLTHLPSFATTAIFIEPADTGSMRDHVDSERAYAIVVSPYARHRYIGMRHLSTASVLKTEEEMLGLPALSLGDALASDMREFFMQEPDVTPYSQIVAPPQSGAAGSP